MYKFSIFALVFSLIGVTAEARPRHYGPPVPRHTPSRSYQANNWTGPAFVMGAAIGAAAILSHQNRRAKEIVIVDRPIYPRTSQVINERLTASSSINLSSAINRWESQCRMWKSDLLQNFNTLSADCGQVTCQKSSRETKCSSVAEALVKR